MQISHNSRSKCGHKAVLGMLLGMGVGTAVAWLLNGNATVGMGFGMFAGVTVGICVDQDLPKRSRIAWSCFALAVLSFAGWQALIEIGMLKAL